MTSPLTDSEATSLADAVNAAASRAPAGARFCGGRKVFISELAKTLAYQGGLDLLKSRLVELNRRGLVTLVRFDLSYAHDRDVQAASEIRDSCAAFHCVEDRSHRGW